MRINAEVRRRRNILRLVGDLDRGPSEQAARLPQGYRAASLEKVDFFVGAQPAFLTQNLHQPFGLISPSTSVHAFGSWNSEQLLHS